jgi:hypothetical protein
MHRSVGKQQPARNGGGHHILDCNQWSDDDRSTHAIPEDIAWVCGEECSSHTEVSHCYDVRTHYLQSCLRKTRAKKSNQAFCVREEELQHLMEDMNGELFDNELRTE